VTDSALLHGSRADGGNKPRGRFSPACGDR